MGRRGEIGKRGRGTCSWGNKSTQQQHLIKAEDAQHIAVVIRWGMERGWGGGKEIMQGWNPGEQIHLINTQDAQHIVFICITRCGQRQGACYVDSSQSLFYFVPQPSQASLTSARWDQEETSSMVKCTVLSSLIVFHINIVEKASF